MTWFKVDDSLHSHKKAMRAGTEAMGLWVLAGSWAADQLTDGWVPAYAITRWAANAEMLAEKLVWAGLWIADVYDGDDGWWFHQWDERQPTRDDVLGRRKADADRRAKWRDSRKNREHQAESQPVSQAESHDVSRRDTPRDTDGDSQGASRQGSVLPDPTRPVPTTEDLLGGRDRPPQPKRLDAERLCNRLHELIVANGSKATITGRWRAEARLMLDRDERPLAEALRLIEWCQADPFWQSNILSLPKFRAKYDQLRLKARTDPRWLTTGPIQAVPDVEINPDVVLGPDSWSPPTPPLEIDEGPAAQRRDWFRQQTEKHRAERLEQARAVLARRQDRGSA